MTERPLRVMWLLNHTTARQFEVPMLKRIGVREVFLPKRIPADPAFRSASIDWSEDQHLSIPADDLAILNAADWYDDPGREAWEIANKHFDIAFFILLKTAFFRSMTRHFGGAKIWRAYGLPEESYSDSLTWRSHREGLLASPQALDSRFWFGQAYAHLENRESPYLQKRALFFPAGLPDARLDDKWSGTDKRIFFICPDLGFSTYYQKVYSEFEKTFSGLPYVVGGAQPAPVPDSHVLGFQPSEVHRRNMQELRVMFYHGADPNHVHYHPFEAIRAGMPLVFMAGGLLDKLGGNELPGRCRTQAEARSKIERILNDDRRLIAEIRTSQPQLLEPLMVESCEPSWRSSIRKVLEELRTDGSPVVDKRGRRKRVAVIVPVKYRGGSLRGAKLLARAIQDGSRAAGDNVEVVFGHLDDSRCYPSEEFTDLPVSIKRRPFRWRMMSYQEASRACVYAGIDQPLVHQLYQAPDDGINQFMDCDLWVIVSDRLELPLLPVRPHVLMVYDYLQRYVPVLEDITSQQFVARAHVAEAVFVTTEFTRGDALQFAGLPAGKVRKVPMLAPDFSGSSSRNASVRNASYFLWTTNLAPHKNHETAMRALQLYYEDYDGELECRVTGVETGNLLKKDLAHLAALNDILLSSDELKRKFRVEGELSDRVYRRQLNDAAFLWHPGLIDNGTFSVVEAAHFGVPSLSSDYPAMREIDQQFSLNLCWMDADDPDNMARQLKKMETDGAELRQALPSAEKLASQSVDKLSGAYWDVVRDYL